MNRIIDDSDDEDVVAVGTPLRDHIIISSDEETDFLSKQSFIAHRSQEIVDSSSENDDEDFIQNSEGSDEDIINDSSEGSIPKIEENAKAEPKTLVNQAQYTAQQRRVEEIELKLAQTMNALHTIKLDTLPDKGQRLREQEKALKQMAQLARENLDAMVVDYPVPNVAQNKIQVAWDQIQHGVNAVMPKHLGKKGMDRFHSEKEMAVETLNALHKSLDTCPKSDEYMDDPKGLKIELMPHQKHALAWLLWREKQQPSGGLLADDMGLGKTLTMISLIKKSKEMYPDRDSNRDAGKYPGGTLVVCPASLLHQWSSEIERRTKRGLFSVEHFHGAKRETRAKRLAEHDIVITTYAIIMNETSGGPAMKVDWERIILDEAHQIRNHKSRTSEQVCKLNGKSRWALTGTPIQNKELDMYAILKFLRCVPFDDLKVWKHWVSDKSTGGQERLHAVISSLMLRRTKAELMISGSLGNMPERKWELVPITLEKRELQVYQKIMVFSRTLFAQFLHQKAEKGQDSIDLRLSENTPMDPDGKYFKMWQKVKSVNKMNDIKQHHILVLLLRLRQICCHPSLIIKMIEGNEDLTGGDTDEEIEEMNLLDQLNKLDLNQDEEQEKENQEPVGLAEAAKSCLNPNDPIFSPDHESSKVKVLIDLLKEKTSNGDKAIVVSQWRTLLDTIAGHLRRNDIKFQQLDGTIPVLKRQPIVDNVNDPKHTSRVLLLSLTAGGVGLNLVGANHLFLLDLHWNPQLENQAQDRIYRMGQTKPIFVYKLMAVDTIEERIKGLQDKKLEIAESLLSGSKQMITNKLSLQDLKTLFSFN